MQRRNENFTEIVAGSLSWRFRARLLPARSLRSQITRTCDPKVSLLAGYGSVVRVHTPGWASFIHESPENIDEAICFEGSNQLQTNCSRFQTGKYGTPSLDCCPSPLGIYRTKVVDSSVSEAWLISRSTNAGKAAIICSILAGLCFPHGRP